MVLNITISSHRYVKALAFLGKDATATAALSCTQNAFLKAFQCHIDTGENLCTLSKNIDNIDAYSLVMAEK